MFFYSQVDVIIVDLDGGSVHIPECVNLPMLPEPILTRTKKSLTMVGRTVMCREYLCVRALSLTNILILQYMLIHCITKNCCLISFLYIINTCYVHYDISNILQKAQIFLYKNRQNHVSQE